MLGLARYWLEAYGRSALLLALGLALGYPILRRRFSGPAVPLFSILLGLSLLSLFVCVLGWLHLFYGWSIIAIAVVATAITAVSLRHETSGWRTWLHSRPRPTVAQAACFGVLGLALLAFSGLALYPSTAFDATSYHLPLARNLVTHHGLSYDPFVRYSFFPQANEAVFAVMLLLSRDPVSSAALECSVLAVTVLLIPAWFLGSRRSLGAGFVGGLVVLASPVVIWDGTAAFVDTWAMSFILAGLLSGSDAVRNKQHSGSSVALMGVFLGEAAATKYTGALFGACGVIGVLIAAGPRSDIWRAVPRALGGFLLIALPWYAWTIHTTGDPVYPFATGVFGNRHGLWTPAEIQLQDAVARASPRSGIRSILHQDLRYLAGELPYNTGTGRSPLSWWLGAGALGLLTSSCRRDRLFVGVLVSGVLCVLVSLLGSADPRYLIPAIGLLALAAALAAEPALRAAAGWIRAAGWMSGRRGRVLIPVACVLAAVAGLWSPTGYVRSIYSIHGRPPTFARQIQNYLAANVGCYAAVAYLNRRAGSRYRAWAYACEEDRYYARGLLISDAFSVGGRDRVFDDEGATLPTAQMLWRRLQPLHVRWMILPRGTPPTPTALDPGGLFQLVAAAGSENVYRVLG